MPTFQSNQIDFNFEVLGKGTPLVFCHGLNTLCCFENTFKTDVRYFFVRLKIAVKICVGGRVESSTLTYKDKKPTLLQTPQASSSTPPGQPYGIGLFPGYKQDVVNLDIKEFDKFFNQIRNGGGPF